MRKDHAGGERPPANEDIDLMIVLDYGRAVLVAEPLHGGGLKRLMRTVKAVRGEAVPSSAPDRPPRAKAIRHIIATPPRARH